MQQEQTNSDPDAMSVDGSGSSAPEVHGFLAEAVSPSAWKPDGASGEKNDRGNLKQVAVSKDEIFKLLSNPRRRHVLYHLTQNATEVDIGTLATQIAAWENDIEVSEVSGMQRKRVYTSLQQVHLPKMDGSGVIVFDKRAGKITLKASLTELEFGKDFHNDRPWYRSYATLSAGNAVVVGLTMSNIWTLGSVPVVFAMALISTLYVLLTVVHMAVSKNLEMITRFLKIEQLKR